MKKNSIPIIIIFILVSIAAAYFVFFQETEEEYSGPIEDITVQLKWMHQAQFAGNYVAEQKGFYKDLGLNVELESFDYTNNPISEVLDERADFGIIGAGELIKARVEGKPIKALAVIYQDNPVTAYTLASSGIDSPDDFIGKRVGIQTGINVEYQIQAMLNAVGVDYNTDITVKKIGFGINKIIDEEIDVGFGYMINEPIQVEEEGYEINIIHPAEYGINVYGDVLFTTEEMIKNRPDLVYRFVKATLKGWDYALENQSEAVNFTLLYEDPNNDALNFKHQKAMLEKSAPLIQPSKSVKVGQMNFVRWKASYDLMQRYDLLNKDINIQDAYTTEFLEFNNFEK